MKDYQLTSGNLDHFFFELCDELKERKLLVITTQSGGTGKWGMTRLWRQWMDITAKWAHGNGVTMPLAIKQDGTFFGKRPFNANDAHDMYTRMWLCEDGTGTRLSWAKQGHDGMRAATKGERFKAMLHHEVYSAERGIVLFKPRDSEFVKLQDKQNK